MAIKNDTDDIIIIRIVSNGAALCRRNVYNAYSAL